jgi:hypothetical protein
MANKRNQKLPVIRVSIKKTTKTQIDRRSAIACKMLQVAGYPELFDTLSKNQKKFLLCCTIEEPDIRSEKPNTVPRQYVNNVRDELFDYMRTHYVGDKSICLSYMEFISFGAGFMDVLQMNTMFTDKQKEIISRGDNFKSYMELLRYTWSKIAVVLSCEIRHYSQVQFRTYGHTMGWTVKNLPACVSHRLTIRITSRECEKTYFKHNNMKRCAYRIWTGDCMEHNNKPVTIPLQKLFPYSNSDKKLELFIQAHAIHRYKERFDVFDPTDRNYLLISSLYLDQVVKMGRDGPMLACMVGDAAFGYFPFTVQGNKLFILTFLPLINDMTYEGKKFADKLNLKKEELVHLGMDKLAFFGDIDFKQIPVLKKALIDSDLWGVIDFLETLEEFDEEYDEARTSFVKHFFEKQNVLMDNTHILDEIAANEETE